MLLKLAINAIIFACLLTKHLHAAPSFALELAPVKIHVDKDQRIHVSYHETCGAAFSGFLLRTSARLELQVAVIQKRQHGRCSELRGMQQLVIPELKASQFAGITSMNPSLEPFFLKTSPIQNTNLYRNQGQIEFQALYTSQCGTPLGLLFQPMADGYRFGVMEGRTTKFANCNRSSKLVSYPGLDFSKAPRNLVKSFENDDERSTYTLRRANTRLSFDESLGAYRVSYLRACNEAPIGMVRQSGKDGSSISILVAHYADMRCDYLRPKKFWTQWTETVPKTAEKLALSFEAARTEKLTIARPLSYAADPKGSKLEITSHRSCHKDIGIVSRASRLGYAIGILQYQDRAPCNSSLKQVTYTYSWSFDALAKQDVKPLQLVGM